MEVLWIHWLGVEWNNKWGFKEAHLLKVGFVPDHPDHVPFGFLDPSLVLHRCHLIPSFLDSHTHELLLPGEVDNWVAFYINMLNQQWYKYSENVKIL